MIILDRNLNKFKNLFEKKFHPNFEKLFVFFEKTTKTGFKLFLILRLYMGTYACETFFLNKEDIYH